MPLEPLGTYGTLGTLGNAYFLALTLLSARELSESQLRTRLKRREIAEEEIGEAISRLKGDGTLDDRRVARAIARIESAIKHRGRARVIQKIRQAGIDGDTAEDAVREIFEEVDEHALLDRALARRLRGQDVKDLDDKGRARIIRGLAAQGFPLDAILKRIKN
jgi:regulatory protein